MQTASDLPSWWDGRCAYTLDLVNCRHNQGHHLIKFVAVHCHPPDPSDFWKDKASEFNADVMRTSSASFRAWSGGSLCSSPCDMIWFLFSSWLGAWGRTFKASHLTSPTRVGSSCPTDQGNSVGLSANHQVYPYQLCIYAFSTAACSLMETRTPFVTWIVKVHQY